MEVNIWVSEKELAKLIPWELSDNPEKLLLLCLYEKYGIIKIYDDIDDMGTFVEYENKEEYEILRRYILARVHKIEYS